MDLRQTHVFLLGVIAVALAPACGTPVPWPEPQGGVCAEKNGGCDSNAICSVATNATTATCVCKAGFSGDGQSCACTTMGDVIVDGGCFEDACATNNGGCDPNATCANTTGAPACTCKAGYTGDGQSCTVVPVDAGEPDDAGNSDGGDLDGGDQDGGTLDGG